VFFFTRPNDAKAILDRLDVIAEVAGVTIDDTRVAVLGHSAGAHAVMGLAGAAIQVSPTIAELPADEPRFKAFVAASPQGVGRAGLHEMSWDPITAPILIQTGQRDETPREQAEDRLDAFQHLAGPDAYQQYVDAEATSHDVFALSGTPGVTGIELTLASTAIAFLDAYLLDRAEAKDWLASDALFEATEGVSTLSAK
jgi:predicted dienelactone hydrolase